MNRHDRRRDRARGFPHGAENPGRRTGYAHRLFGNVPVERGKVVHVQCAHDDNCAIYSGRECSCIPEITIITDDAVITIDEDGRATRRMKS